MKDEVDAPEPLLILELFRDSNETEFERITQNSLHLLGRHGQVGRNKKEKMNAAW